MVSCRALRCANRADKNSNIIYIIITVSRHIQNLGIVRTVNSGIFMYIQGHSTIFSHVQAYYGILRWLAWLIKGALSGLRKFLATESPLKMMKNAFYFTPKALFVLKIFKFLS